MRPFVLALVAGCFVAAASPLQADVVRMKDGRTFQGQITEEDHRQAKIDAMVAGIRVTLTLKKDDIDTLERKPLPEGFFEGEQAAARPADGPAQSASAAPVAPAAPKEPAAAPQPPANAPREPEPAEKGVVSYLEVPLRGVFGIDIAPEGVADVLEYASQRPDIQHIVFILDSDGGLVGAADEILALMKKHDQRFTYHTIIRKAISASIWVVFASDHLYMEEGGTLGGAVVYYETDLGQIEVNAKMNSIIAAGIRAAAEAKGHPGALVQPMILQDATVAAWLDENGRVQIAPSLPGGTHPSSVLVEDTRNTVLTLTKKQAVDVGLADEIAGGPENVAALRGYSQFRRYNEQGARSMTWASERLAAEHDQIREAMERFVALASAMQADVAEAQANDPANGQYHYNGQTGYFTPHSARAWRENSDAAIRAWMRVKERIEELRQIQQMMKEKGFEEIIPEFNIQDVLERCDRAIQELRRNRTRHRI